ncbi:PREDICTED: rhythmically expressed gene 5 protein-like [Rhagoletis zephyria]|uniref:rhythmically expressed gene 5 protein-like n=1 Tax=Rhagoletis zephyria TaxID=28612 RepID=UPI0008119A2D|nr:PREDICTED: rhythmically expressed gene 5 protein-like [Rhagoletis zephyria]
MREHPSSTLVTTRKPLPTPPDSSIIILTHQKTANTAAPSFANAAAAASSTTTNSQNPLFDSDADHKHKFAWDMDFAYGYPVTQTTVNQKPHAETFLSGPLVFRVRPDGTPVEEDQHKPLPRDEDLEAYQLSSAAAGRGGAAASTAAPAVSGQPKHRKIAMISDLKQQHLASMALHRDLQPPYQQQLRIRRQQQQQQQNVAVAGRAFPFGGYYYAQGQA